MAETETGKKKPKLDVVWREARELIWSYRRRLGAGLGLLVISRLSGMVLPASTKLLIDDVIGDGRSDLLPWIAVAVVIATLIQSGTSFTLAILPGSKAEHPALRVIPNLASVSFTATPAWTRSTKWRTPSRSVSESTDTNSSPP